MATITRIAPDMVFDFDFYRFNGKGVKPNLVPTAEQANIMRSRSSVDGSLVDIATQRAVQLTCPPYSDPFRILGMDRRRER